MTQFFINSTKILVNDGHIKIRTGDSSSPPPQTVAGYLVSVADNNLYNGTYCLTGTNSGIGGSSIGSNIYKHQTANIYIYFGGTYTWIGPVVGNIYGDSDGYYTMGESDPIPNTVWYAYSCCMTSLGGSVTVTTTTCYI